jgi:predicted RNA binding protein YcfA (HicA-like mRNA interferase family)
MATKKIKINFKMPTQTAAERLHAQQQKNRKAAGLPDPSEYKKKLDSMKSENYEEDDGPLSQEQLDEISAKLKASYVSGAKKQIKQSEPFTKKGEEYRDIAKNFIAKRQKGIAKANEEVEQIDELSKETLKSYIGKSTKDMVERKRQQKIETDRANFRTRHAFAKQRGHAYAARIGDEAKKRAAGIGKAAMKIATKNEEVELLDEMPESNMKVRDVHSHLKKAGWELARSKGGHDVFKHPKAKHSIPVPRHSLKAPLVRGIMKASKVEEQLEKKGRFVSGPVKQPFKSNTVVTPVKEAKDSQEYDYEGDMAKSDLRSILHHAKELHDMIEDNTNLAEWCQSKITLAEDYLSTVANYMRSEMNEEVDLDEMIRVKTNKPIGTRVADIGPGGKEYNVKTDKAYDDAKKKQPQGAEFAAQRRKERLAKSGRMDEKKNLPGLWANIHAKRKRGEPPAKPGDKDYPETLNIESASEPTEGEMKGKQGYSRKAQIVRDAAKGKKSDSSDKFQKDPELSSEIHKT